MPGITSWGTCLEFQKDGKWEEIPNVKGFPQPIEPPEMVDTSVVNAKNGSSSPGQSKATAIQFRCAYGDETGKGKAQDAETNYGKAQSNVGKIVKYRIHYPDHTGFELDALIWVGPPEQFEGANNPLVFPIILYPQGDVKALPSIE